MRVFLAILSSALLWASFPPLGWAWVGWIALAPLLMALDGATPRQGERLGLLAGFLFFAGAASWFWAVFPWTCIGLWFIEGLFLALFGLLVASMGRRGWAWHLLGVPALWVGIEWLRAEGNPLCFGWFVLGLSQSPSEHFRQAADLGGAYGLSFLLAFVSACFAFRRQEGLRARDACLAMIAAGLVIAGTYGYGSWAARRWRVEGQVTAAVVQVEGTGEREHLDLTTGIAGRKPRLVVWPELALAMDVEKDPATMAHLRFMALALDTALVTGCIGGEFGEPTTWENRAMLVGNDGRVLGHYVKHVPIQFFDDGVAGTGTPVFETPAGKLGICICYDLDYPWVTRGLVRAGAEILAVPTLDLASWGGVQHRQHTANARVRAVTHRRYLLRACSSGISQIIAPDGRIEAEVPDMAVGVAVGKVAPVSAKSPYDRGGWILAPACAVWTALLAGWLLLRKMRHLT
jgi:apolipoprotein N-acyltransferase